MQQLGVGAAGFFVNQLSVTFPGRWVLKFHRNSFIVNCSCFVGALECLKLRQIFPLVQCPHFNWSEEKSVTLSSNCTWGSACTRAARRSSFSRHRASCIRVDPAQELGQTDVSCFLVVLGHLKNWKMLDD